MTRTAAIILFVIILGVVAGPSISGYNPVRIDLDAIKLSPSPEHPFGTDNKGRDVLSRTLYGGRVTLLIVLGASVITFVIGMFVGLVSGYFGGKLDLMLMGIVDVLLSFPTLLLAIGISILMPPGILSVLIAIGSVGWVGLARLVRGQVVVLKESQQMEAARALGASELRVLLVYIFPQALPVALVALSMKMGGFILSEAALSFLGLGVQPPWPTWGSMIGQSRIFITSAPWMVIFPGLMIGIAALSFNMLGEGLRDRLNVFR